MSVMSDLAVCIAEHLAEQGHDFDWALELVCSDPSEALKMCKIHRVAVDCACDVSGEPLSAACWDPCIPFSGRCLSYLWVRNFIRGPRVLFPGLR